MAADPPALRAADADRERAVAALGHHAAAGRLTLEELDERTHAAYAAVTLPELDALLADLPADPGAAPARVPADSPEADALREDFRSHLTAYVLVQLLLIGIWAATGAGYFWPIFPALGWGIGVAFDYAEKQRSLRRLSSASPEQRAAIVAEHRARDRHGCAPHARRLPAPPRP